MAIDPTQLASQIGERAVTQERDEINREVDNDPSGTGDPWPIDYPPPGAGRVVKPDPQADKGESDDEPNS
jgi:hypothetical protein